MSPNSLILLFLLPGCVSLHCIELFVIYVHSLVEMFVEYIHSQRNFPALLLPHGHVEDLQLH